MGLYLPLSVNFSPSSLLFLSGSVSHLDDFEDAALFRFVSFFQAKNKPKRSTYHAEFSEHEKLSEIPL